ncbi:MAG: DEAD/DEAH box helicase family protein, partial [Sulfuricurvum sp.]|nr:DEAD/DEAH box helicase family protein [Sulfuricurvum sp.]
MAKKKSQSTQPDIDQYSLFTNLLAYYERNKGMIKKKYRRVTKVYLDYNEDGYLREPQFKALEIYVFMKEFFENKKVFDVFTHLYEQEELAISTTQGKQGVFNFVEDEQKLFDGYYKDLKKQLEQLKRNYPDYVFALTMGTGKTILMATTIFYEFILANKFPKDKLYAHNALVFAPDRTVLESLREIITFDKSL